MEIFEFLSKYYSCSFGEVVGLFTPFKMDQIDMVSTKDKDAISTNITLSSKQQEAFEFIKSEAVTLLFGDTGSGKSEIYFKLFEEMVSSGKSCIFLMPEISLTPQMEKRLKSYFGDMVAIWHSKVTKTKKELVLKGIEDGSIKIVAGARSALFLPMKNLGAIVVDEEHDDSYKSAKRPRINAKDVAVYMGRKLKAKVVLGSATPLASSYAKYPNFRLKGTFYNSKKSFIFENSTPQITPPILKEIKQSLENRRQLIVFLPTRANFKYISCLECGEIIKCPFCSVGMSLHLNKNALVCHYCNYTSRIEQNCPKCGSGELSTNRLGTAEVVERLRDEFPDAVIAKFDSDEITTAKKLKAFLKKVNDREIDVVVGTQMISKGHDYPNVDLAVIMGIDSILAMGDFRARERAMSLLLQIAGRSGRSGEGRVVLQSQNREFFESYLGDYESFLKDELEFRKKLYPPYKRLLKIEVSHKSEKKARDRIYEIRERLEVAKDVEIVGVGEAPIKRISSKHRFHILLRSKSATALLNGVRGLEDSMTAIDIDPVSFS